MTETWYSCTYVLAFLQREHPIHQCRRWRQVAHTANEFIVAAMVDKIDSDNENTERLEVMSAFVLPEYLYEIDWSTTGVK